MTKHTSPFIGLLFRQCNSTILNMLQGIVSFPLFLKQMKRQYRTYSDVTESTLNRVKTILQLWKSTTLLVNSQNYIDNKATRSIQTSWLWENDGDFLIAQRFQQHRTYDRDHQFTGTTTFTPKRQAYCEFFELDPWLTKRNKPVITISVRHPSEQQLLWRYPIHQSLLENK